MLWVGAILCFIVYFGLVSNILSIFNLEFMFVIKIIIIKKYYIKNK